MLLPDIQHDLIRYRQYHYNLKTPFVLQSGETISKRTGILLYYPLSNSADTQHIIADVAPLPGFSKETCEDIINELETSTIVSPSLQFGVECIQLSLYAQQHRCHISQAIQKEFNSNRQLIFSAKTNCPLTVPTNALLRINSLQLENEFNQLITQTPCTIKLKLGYNDFKTEIKQLQQLCLQSPNTIQFRLDPNQSWSPAALRALFDEIPPNRIEYIEDPTPTLAQVRACKDHYSKIALDHLAMELTKNDPLINQINAIIYKPTLNGGISSLINRFGHQIDTLKIIISHTFESDIGMFYLKNIAIAVAPNQCHGISQIRKDEIFIEEKPIT
jgi:O-succinylbenzoate synthase